ncbi:chitosanase [Streptomyces sp. NPDC059496]|uniref:chitosanase n=1 Tax=Streptomyces sp. NPDC059496 TaxID=3346851 RepID=UPI0036994990
MAAWPLSKRRRADQLVSVFDTTEIQYGYAKNIRDGRGVTAGRAGLATFDGDALKVIEACTVRSPDNPLSRFIPELRRLGPRSSSEA